MKQHVLHTIFSLYTGGAELMLIDIINCQVEFIDVSIAIINDYDEKLIQKIDKRVNVICLNRKPRSKNPFPLIKINLIASQKKHTAIHCHNVNLIDVFLLKRAIHKTALTIHDTNIKYDNFNKYQRLFAISNSVKKDIEKRYKLEPILVYNGVDTIQIEQKSNFDSENALKIVQVSRLMHTKKGQDILITAIAKLLEREEKTDILVDFIGDGESQEYLKNLAQELNVSDKINFLGLKDRNYIYSNLCNYDLLVQPSIYEGFGLTVAEAMIAKVPVLVSDIEGPMEVINNGEFGFYFKKGDVDDLADKLEYLINNKPKQEFIDEAYKYAKREFDIENTAKNYIKEYNNLNLIDS